MEFDQLIIWLMSFGPVIIPVFTFLGADHAMFAMILANDMGGYLCLFFCSSVIIIDNFAYELQNI